MLSVPVNASSSICLETQTKLALNCLTVFPNVCGQSEVEGVRTGNHLSSESKMVSLAPKWSKGLKQKAVETRIGALPPLLQVAKQGTPSFRIQPSQK